MLFSALGCYNKSVPRLTKGAYDFPEWSYDREFNILYLRGVIVQTPTLQIREEISSHLRPYSGLSILCRGVAQPVARTAGGREVAGSNPVAPTIKL